ncbi:hypothetical protein [Pseudomonas putida]|uniref:hypothetical protein n=1 Tax=Pseudomonas putida TaxID=303 RepID=UPI00292A5637|nr:hypothetical protein [Pseudomonas putida]
MTEQSEAFLPHAPEPFYFAGFHRTRAIAQGFAPAILIPAAVNERVAVRGKRAQFSKDFPGVRGWHVQKHHIKCIGSQQAAQIGKVFKLWKVQARNSITEYRNPRI